MEATYNEATIFWQRLRRELTLAIAEKEAFMKQGGVDKDDLDLSSEEEAGELDSDALPESEDESTTERRRFDG